MNMHVPRLSGFRMAARRTDANRAITIRYSAGCTLATWAIVIGIVCAASAFPDPAVYARPGAGIGAHPPSTEPNTLAASSASDTVAASSPPKRRVALVRCEDRSGFPAHGLGAGEAPEGLAGNLLLAGLIAGGECIVLKRGGLGDMDRVAGEQGREPEVIGVTAFIYGTVDKLSLRVDAPEVGSSAAVPRSAHAKVSVRMVDPLTGVTFFSESGEAESVPAPTRLFGFLTAADADSTLPERALRAAVDKLVGSMAASLRGQPWRAGILEAGPGKIVIAAGARAGLRPGQELRIVRPGMRIKDPASGVLIELPGEAVGRIKVVSQFGTGELDEGSVCSLIQGSGITKADRVELDEGL